ncbi:MAG: hypothetical protein PCFJNLEI_02174 [Verrucomicrobiae bacterium]|nr:hypothetical protein [Verrucomicrobiae bacterium]
MSNRHALTPRPPLGWNSYDCLGCVANERRLLENLRVFVERLQPHGYEYFVLDGGWYRQHELGDREFPVPGEPCTVGVDEFGRPQPAPVWFPNGVAAIAAACHAHGVRFGIHMMRGIPRVAVERNLPIAGTAWRARDVANPADGCSWCPDNCGVNVAHPGGRAYYASVIVQLADWGVDFIKYDDMIPAPDEVDAVADALAACPRPMVLSLSPGDGHHSDRWATYQRANLIRLTGDIWDDRDGFAQVFERWQKLQDRLATWPAGCWVDQDMIPFGELCLWNPDRGVPVGHVAFAGKGVHRRCQFTPAQQRTFLTMRALGASPLFMGGHLPGTDDATFALLTDPDLLACNQNATPGHVTMLSDTLALWQSPERDAPQRGWLGLFNRDPQNVQTVSLDPVRLDLPRKTEFHVIWGETQLLPDDVLFVRYESASR